MMLRFLTGRNSVPHCRGIVWGTIWLGCLGICARPLAAQGPEFVADMFRLSDEQRQQLQSVDVPLPQERQYGRQVFEGYQQQLRLQNVSLSNKGRDVLYLKELVSRLQPLMENAKRYPKIEVYLLDSTEIDARSCPGGYLIFSRGLLEFAESEAALVGIVGHELSHLDRGHQLKPLQQQQLLKQKSSPLFANSIPSFSEFFEGSKMMMNVFHPFHPDEEAEADTDSVKWMGQLGYDAKQLAKLFSRLAEHAPGPAGFMPPFMRTHPANLDRAKNILQQIQDEARDGQGGQAAPIIGIDNLAQRRPAALPHVAPQRRR